MNINKRGLNGRAKKNNNINVPVNKFSVMLRRSHLFLGITSTFGE